MPDATCSHESNEKIWLFKWWLCPECMALARKIIKDTIGG